MKGRKISSIMLLVFILLTIFLFYHGEEAKAQTIDYIVITDTPDGNWLGWVTLPVGGTVAAYASGYNSTGEYVGLVEVNWSGGGGSWNPTPANASTFTAGTTPGNYSQTAQNVTLGVSDTFVVEILSPTVDYITITDAPNSTPLTTVTLTFQGTVTAYASGYNVTGPTYVGLVEANWNGGGGNWSPYTGKYSTFTAGKVGGIYTQTAENPSLGVSDTFDVEIIGATIDFIRITDAPGGAELTTVTLSIGGSITAYASGYNSTGPTYIELVEVDWSGAGGTWSPVTGSSSTFTAGNTSGLYTQTAQNTTMGVSDTFDVNITTLAYIIITDVPGGAELTTVTLAIGGTVHAYASGYNSTGDYIDLIVVEWGGGGGSWSPHTGNSSTFMAGTVGGSYIQSAWYAPLGINDTFYIEILSPTVDYINITDGPNGAPFVTVILPYYGLVTAYASGYNYTGPTYVGLVEVNWSGGGGTWVPEIGKISKFYAGNTSGVYTQTGENTSLGVSDTFDVKILPYYLDYIIITDSPNGTELTTVFLDVGGQITAYASGYNGSGPAGPIYVGLVEVDWSESEGLGSFSNLTGSSTTFTAGNGSGTTTITGQDIKREINDTFIVVLGPHWTIDYIKIRTQPDDGGKDLCDPANYPSYPIGHITTFYGAAYNHSHGYIGDVGSSSTWNSSDAAIVNVTSPGSSSTITCSLTKWGTVTITLNDTEGHQNTTQVTVLEPTLDIIIITDSPNGNEVLDMTLPIGGTITFYASGYNSTSMDFLSLVNVNWSQDPELGTLNPLFDTSSTFTAISPGSTVISGEKIINGTVVMSDSFYIYIHPPEIDHIIITDTPGGSELTTVTLGVGEQVTAYASGYNSTGEYVGLVEVNWSESEGLGSFDNLTGNSTTFTAGGTGGLTIVTGENLTLSVNDTFEVNIIAATVDYIKIRNAPSNGGSVITSLTLDVGESYTLWAAAYNYSYTYLGDFTTTTWNETSGGSVITVTSPGASTNVTAQTIGGISTITAMCNGAQNTTSVTVNPPTINYITLTDIPGGTELVMVILPVGGQITAYASGYNYTIDYVDLVEVNWYQSPTLGSFDNAFGNSTTFTAGFTGGLTTITGQNISLGLSDTFFVNITPPTVDYIQIRTQPGGGGINLSDPANYLTYPVGASDIYYGASYNLTAGYIGKVPTNSTWVSSNPDIVNVTSPGNSSDITCSNINWGVVIVTLEDDEGHSNTTEITVLQPTVDYIRIRDEPNGSGNIVTEKIYIVWQEDLFYAAAYNYTADYLGEVEAVWWSNDTAVGTVTSPGPWTKFTAQKIVADSICYVTAEYDGIQNFTGDLTVLAPTIDFITIMDLPNGVGQWVENRTYNEGDDDTFWAAGFNFTANHVKDVKAVWSSNNTTVGKVTPGPSEFTNFTAGWKGGYCRVTAIYQNLTNHTGPLFVINVNQLPTADAKYHNGTGFAGGDFSFSADITLRVTGRKQNIVKMELEEDGIVVKEVVVTRHSNEPDIGKISHMIDVNKIYEIVLYYNGHNGGSNPIIVTFEFLEKIYSVHLLFNSKHGVEQIAIISFNDVCQLVGVVFFDGYFSSDFDGFLTDYQWDFGDGTFGNGETLAHTYEDNGKYTITLTVTDDEGGTDSSTIAVYVENMDNNDQANAIPNRNESKAYMNESGHYVVILECPADLLISNSENMQIGLSNEALINDLEGAFVAMLFSDVEVYYIPNDESYIFEVTGTGSGVYDLSIIGVKNDISKIYSAYNVSCSENTLDRYIFDFKNEKIILSTKEDDKLYSMEFLMSMEDLWDRFYLTNMKLNKNATHTYQINDWESLSSGKPVTFSIDEDRDGVIDKSVDLESGLTGDDVEALLFKAPVAEPAFPILLFLVVGLFCAVGVGTLLTEVGKWALISLFLPLYSRIKKGELLNQPVRYKIHGYLIGNPGAHFGLIKQDLGIPNGQLAYHLRQMMKAKILYSKEDGIRKRFYPSDFPKPKTDEYYFSETQEKILGIVKNNSGISQKKIASSMGISRQVAGYHLTKMEEIGAIRKEVEGRESTYYPIGKHEA